MILLKKTIKKLVRRILERASLMPAPHSTPITLEYITRLLPSNPVIVEAGAHDGSNTVDLAAIKGSRVHCFEPIPDVFDKLLGRTSCLSNVHRYQSALGDSCGTVEMFVSSGRNDASSSILEPKVVKTVNPGVLFESKIDVNITTMDDWAEKYCIPQVDFLWLDMQGYELAALRSAHRLLQSVSVIYTEVNLLEVYKGAPLYHDVWNWMDSNGFRVEKIDFVWPDQGEVLFVKK